MKKPPIVRLAKFSKMIKVDPEDAAVIIHPNGSIKIHWPDLDPDAEVEDYEETLALISFFINDQEIIDLVKKKYMKRLPDIN